MRLKEWKLPKGNYAVFCSSDRKYCCVHMLRKVKFYQLPDRKLLFDLRISNPNKSYFSPLSNYCVITTCGKELYVVDMEKQEVMYKDLRANIPEWNTNVIFFDNDSFLYAREENTDSMDFLPEVMEYFLYRFEIPSKTVCPFGLVESSDTVHLVREGEDIKILGTIEDREMEESDYIIYTFHIPTGEITEQRFVAPRDCKRFLAAGDYCPETGAYIIPMDIGVRIYNKEFKAESSKRTQKNVYGTYWLKGGKYFIVDYLGEWQLYSYTPGAVPKLEARNQGEYTGLVIPQDSSKSFFCCSYYESPFVLYQITDD